MVVNGYGRLTRRLVQVVGVVLVVYALLIGVAGVQFPAPRRVSSRSRTRVTSSRCCSCRPAPRSSGPRRLSSGRSRSSSPRPASSMSRLSPALMPPPSRGLQCRDDLLGTAVALQPFGRWRDGDNGARRSAQASLGDPGCLCADHSAAAGAGHRQRGRLQDDAAGPAGLGSDALARAAQTLVAAANRDPDFAGVFTLFSTRSPSVYTDIDREKAEKVGLTPTDVFSTLQVYLGSQYVNDFNYLGRTYQVIAQADGSFRQDANDIGRLKARNSRARWCRSARWRDSRTKLLPTAYHATTFSRLPKSWASLRPASRLARRCTGWRNSPIRCCRPASVSNGPSLLSSSSSGDADAACVRRRRPVRVPGARRTIRELETAARGGDDRADVPARLRHRAAVTRDVDRRSGADRLRRARRPGRQERDPDRRIRPPGRKRAQAPAKPRCVRRAHGFVRSS